MRCEYSQSDRWFACLDWTAFLSASIAVHNIVGRAFGAEFGSLFAIPSLTMVAAAEYPPAALYQRHAFDLFLQFF